MVNQLEKETVAAIAKLQQRATLTDDEVMEILSVLNPGNPRLNRILYGAFCAIQGGDDDIQSLYERVDHWMDYERD
jgi:hypothetical protein